MIHSKKKTINLKPIELDAHFRYECPDKNCRYDHWLSLKEAKTPNFKIVCDCGLVLRPKIIQKIRILYKKKQLKNKTKQETPKHSPQAETIKTTNAIPIGLRDESAKKLISYGFTKEEAQLLCEKAFSINETYQSSVLIKYILEHIKTLESIK